MSDERGFRWTDDICGCCERELDGCGTCKCATNRCPVPLCYLAYPHSHDSSTGSEWAESDEYEP